MEYIVERENNELCHFGIKGMKWGVRRYQNSDGSLTKAGKKRYEEYDKYGNKRKGPFSNMAYVSKSMLEKFNKNNPNLRERIDNSNIDYETKGMTDKQKKLYSLNYYNDRKHISLDELNRINENRQKVNSNNKTRSQQRYIDSFGSDFLNEMYDMQIKEAKSAYKHYSDKVDKTLSEIGDIKLSTIRKSKVVNMGDTTYYWNGDEYVEA